MSAFGKPSRSALIASGVFAGSMIVGCVPALAGKVHWKENPLDHGCFALAFADTDQWFATPKGYAFKRGVCHGQAIQYDVELAEDGESFTASGANFCTYRVGDKHTISMSCKPKP